MCLIIAIVVIIIIAIISTVLMHLGSYMVVWRAGKKLELLSLASNFQGRDTRCDKSLRHVAATGCCNKSPRVTCENHCRCDRILSLRSITQIQTSLNLCNRSQQQNKRKQPCRSVSADEATCRRDVLQRFVASCVSALSFFLAL